MNCFRIFGITNTSWIVWSIDRYTVYYWQSLHANSYPYTTLTYHVTYVDLDLRVDVLASTLLPYHQDNGLDDLLEIVLSLNELPDIELMQDESSHEVVQAMRRDSQTADAEAQKRELQDLYDNFDYSEFYYYRNRPLGKKKKRNTKARHASVGKYV